VADNKISHKDPVVVTEVLSQITGHFGELVISRGAKHDFLGINIKLRKYGLVEVEQHKQIEEVLARFGPFETHKFNSSCTNHLWNVNENAEKLDKEKADLFHSVVAKLLYITKRSRPDIETAVAFLTTRVSKSDVDDLKKLKE